eukprot:363196-Chlamydomonas_euryale.AAC.3
MGGEVQAADGAAVTSPGLHAAHPNLLPQHNRHCKTPPPHLYPCCAKALTQDTTNTPAHSNNICHANRIHLTKSRKDNLPRHQHPPPRITQSRSATSATPPAWPSQSRHAPQPTSWLRQSAHGTSASAPPSPSSRTTRDSSRPTAQSKSRLVSAPRGSSPLASAPATSGCRSAQEASAADKRVSAFDASEVPESSFAASPRGHPTTLAGGAGSASTYAPQRASPGDMRGRMSDAAQGEPGALAEGEASLSPPGTAAGAVPTSPRPAACCCAACCCAERSARSSARNAASSVHSSSGEFASSGDSADSAAATPAVSKARRGTSSSRLPRRMRDAVTRPRPCSPQSLSRSCIRRRAWNRQVWGEGCEIGLKGGRLQGAGPRW